MDMFTEGAMKAVYQQVAELTKTFKDKLTSSNQIQIETGENNENLLTLNVEGREGINSTGVFEREGASGNLPSGEIYIAPNLNTPAGKIN